MNAVKNRTLGNTSETSGTEAEDAVSDPGLAAMIPIRPRLPASPVQRIGAGVGRTGRCDLPAGSSVTPRRCRPMKDTTVARAFPKRNFGTAW